MKVEDMTLRQIKETCKGRRCCDGCVARNMCWHDCFGSEEPSFWPESLLSEEIGEGGGNDGIH